MLEFLSDIDSPMPNFFLKFISRLSDSASRESFFEYKYLPEFEAEIGTAGKVV